MQKKIRLCFMGILILILVFISGINLYILHYSKPLIYQNIAALPQKEAIMVLGAGVIGNQLSPVLEDRVMAGIQIMRQHKAPKILLSGDHGRVAYDEVNSMRKFVLARAPDIAQEDIFMDHAGFDTYDSMFRAKEVFDVHSLIIVTQSFHISRAVYLAKSLGIDAVGYSVNQDNYVLPIVWQWELREFLSRIKAWFNVLFDAQPKFKGPKIPIRGDGRKSWD